jgi:uncharacterized protein (DUF362 family)
MHAPRDTHWAMQASDRTAGLSRRGFLKGVAATSAGLLIGPDLLGAGARADTRQSKVVRAYHPDATTGWEVNQEPVDQMVQAAVRELAGIADTGEAWKSFFPGIDATKKVSVKINLACGDVPTHPEVVNAIIDGLLMMDLGGQTLPPENITIWDADNAFFCAQTGYAINYGGVGVQYYGTDHAGVGYDPAITCTITHPGSHYTYHHPSKIISQRCDYMINAGVIKDHSEAGVTLCLKNNYGSFDGVYSTYTHASAGYARSITALNAFLRDSVGNKTKLFLIDATLGLYTGGPGYTPPGHTAPNWAYKSLLVGNDPVAIDRIGTVKINAERAAHSVAAVNPVYIATAADPPYSLGTDELSQIDLVELDLGAQGVDEGALGPQALALLAPYPNPAPGACTLRFHVAAGTTADLVVVDAAGSLVRRIAGGTFSRGMHRFAWDGRDAEGRRVPSGVYLCRLGRGGRQVAQRSIVLVR